MLDINLMLPIVVNLISVGFFAGIAKTRMDNLDRENARLESTLNEVKQELKEARVIREDLAVIKNQMTEVSRTLLELQKTLHDIEVGNK